MTDNTQGTVSSPKIVFVIEDDVFLVKAYQLKLQKEGVDVWVASNGKEALSYIETKKEVPSVVLLDLMLPQVSGFDVLEAMRKNEKWKNVPVIVLTNLGQPEDIERVKKLGVTDYIIKANALINNVIDIARKHLS